MITDTHTHLYLKEFNSDKAEVIQRAKSFGISRFFVPSIDSSYTQSMLELESEYPNEVFLMMGLHPAYVNENYKKELLHVKKHLYKKRFFGIGEIGIDLYWGKDFLEQQKESFRTQIKWAKEKRLPIIIHCREAFNEVFEVLESEKSKDLFGIFHCFTGTKAQAELAISYNMKLGIGGVVTFKNGKIDNFLNKIDIKHIVLETDSPYLAPTPYRGKRNEPSYIVNIIEKLTSIYNLSFNEIVAITTQNSKEVFGV